MVSNKFKIGEVVTFQAYEENDPIKGKIKRIGTLSELGRMQLDPDDKRIFYELETLEKNHPYVFTVTTDSSMFKIE